MVPLDDPFKAGEIPVKLELRYAIEAKRAEKGLDMPILEEIPKFQREVCQQQLLFLISLDLKWIKKS